MEQKDLIQTIVSAIQEKKGKNIVTINLERIESASFRNFVLCEGSSTTQVAAIADSVREMVRVELGIKPFNYDGYQNSQWIVIDYGDTFVHVFLPETRRFYNLETLWEDAALSAIPDLD